MSADPFTVTTDRHPVALFFDGECCFCNRWVRQLMRSDIRRRTRFGAKQGLTFQRYAALHPEVANVPSIVLVQRDRAGKEKALTHSEAVQEAIRGLPGYGFFSSILAITPRVLSDLGYGVVSKLRRQIAGRQELCEMVQPGDRELFLP